MAEKAGHYWFDMLNTDKFGLTTSKLQLVDNGVYISKYRITVPKELNDITRRCPEKYTTL